jgi:uncharacterized protein with NRDE domain
MCLITIAIEQHPDYPLIVLANRDEYFQRPTDLAGFWPDWPDVYAGRDLLGGGSWLGVTRTGRIAMLTNYRDPAQQLEHALSRGQLVKNYLTCNSNPVTYSQELSNTAQNYLGYNLIIGKLSSLYYFSNQTMRLTKLQAGIYGLSNHLLDTPWPKVALAKKLLGEYLIKAAVVQASALFEILANDMQPMDALLPQTGIPLDLERALARIFINYPTANYGTRCSSLLIVYCKNNLQFWEKTFSLNQE